MASVIKLLEKYFSPYAFPFGTAHYFYIDFEDKCP